MYVVEDAENWGPEGMDFMVWAVKVLKELGIPTDDPKKLLDLIAEKLECYLILRKKMFNNADDAYLFPRERPSKAQLEVSPQGSILLHTPLRTFEYEELWEFVPEVVSCERFD